MKDTLPKNNQHVPECAMLKETHSTRQFFLGKERILITSDCTHLCRRPKENRIGLRGLELLLQALPKAP